MKNALVFNISGIKCDHPECNYRDDSVRLEDYPQWLNKPCPLCGSNLLTQADYDTLLLLTGLVGKLSETVPQVHDEEQLETFKINMNGTGKIIIKKDDTNENRTN